MGRGRKGEELREREKVRSWEGGMDTDGEKGGERKGKREGKGRGRGKD